MMARKKFIRLTSPVVIAGGMPRDKKINTSLDGIESKKIASGRFEHPLKSQIVNAITKYKETYTKKSAEIQQVKELTDDQLKNLVKKLKVYKKDGSKLKLQNIKFYIEFVLIRIFFILVHILPIKITSIFGAKVFRLFGRFSKSHRTAIENCRHVFPNLKDKEIPILFDPLISSKVLTRDIF